MTTIDDVWKLLRTGQREAAKLAVLALLDETPDDPRAWVLAAEISDDPAWQAECWSEVKRLSPEHRLATRRLAALAGRGQADPAAATTVADTPQPSSTRTTVTDATTPAARQALEETLQRIRAAKASGEAPGASQVRAKRAERRSLLSETSEQQAMRVIELAGGPLPPEERRKCPHCDATISRRVTRCEWCGRDV